MLIKMQRYICAGTPWRGPAVLCAVLALLLLHLRPRKLHSEYQRSLLLDQLQLFCGKVGLASPRHYRQHASVSKDRAQQHMLGRMTGTTQDVARVNKIEDELRLVMDARWFQGAGSRVVDRSPPVALGAAIESAQAQAALAQEQLFVWFIGDTDTSGVSWCPDCNNARPFLAARLAELPTAAVVLEVVVSRDEWRNQQHPYRQPPVSMTQQVDSKLRTHV